MKILIIAGEISADLYAHELAKAIITQNKNATIIGIGGKKLKSLSHHFIDDITTCHAVGLTETLFQPQKITTCIKKLKDYLSQNKIDKAIIIDFGKYSTTFAKPLQKNHISIITFITPNFWIWRSTSKAKKLMQYSEKIITIFQEEYKFYKKLNAPVYYFGHPLTIMIPPNTLPIQSNQKSIGLFPGSRKQELNYLLEPILKTAKILQNQDKKIEFYLSVSNEKFYNIIQEKIQKLSFENIHCIIENPLEVYTKSTIVITGAGTSSLEAMLYQKPVIVLGALSTISYFIGRKILKLNIPYIALPNIITNQTLVPEFVQEKIIPAAIAQKAQELLHPMIQKQWQEKFNLIRSLTSHPQNPFEETAKLFND